MTSDQTHLIVGASLAGATAAEILPQEGFAGRVVLVGAERVAVDDRRLSDPVAPLEELAHTQTAGVA